MKKNIIKVMYLLFAFIFVSLGSIGVILPILPTTPFLLLAAYCFARGSTRFHIWFTNTKLYKRHIHDFVKTKAMTLKTKWTILLLASCMLLLGYIVCPIVHGRYVIIAMLLFKYYYFFFRIKTLDNRELA